MVELGYVGRVAAMLVEQLEKREYIGAVGNCIGKPASGSRMDVVKAVIKELSPAEYISVLLDIYEKAFTRDAWVFMPAFAEWALITLPAW
ncbi:hypothetical protein AC578_1295 [Pseudocercospora eumusae]|uniref:Uncharacterized protein n=1 Tax=Pseudocercospora eumusae TaxID=321146 RepID=A0A139HUS2_9PEZI|nr:hypothetical protein AC578_1295 [Pseudocercospora eumusae]